jgi:hypothetical protein
VTPPFIVIFCQTHVHIISRKARNAHAKRSRLRMHARVPTRQGMFCWSGAVFNSMAPWERRRSGPATHNCMYTSYQEKHEMLTRNGAACACTQGSPPGRVCFVGVGRCLIQWRPGSDAVPAQRRTIACTHHIKKSTKCSRETEPPAHARKGPHQAGYVLLEWGGV